MQENIKYGKTVYEISNGAIVVSKEESFKKNQKYILLFAVSAMIFGILSWFFSARYSDDTSYTYGAIFLAMTPLLLAPRVLYDKNKAAKADTSDYCTYIYERGVVFNQGKAFEIGFDEVKDISYKAQKVKRMIVVGHYISINTTRTSVGDKNIIISNSIIGATPIFIDIENFYEHLNNAFIDYKNSNIQ